MTDVPFHLTVMGRRYYETTVPALVAAIERLNENLERLAPVVAHVAPPPPPVAPQNPNAAADG